MTVVLDRLNFRDLGGIPAGQSSVIRKGVLFRGEGPANFCPEHRAAARAHGIRTILDLRSGKEREACPHDWQGTDCQVFAIEVDADLRVFGNEGRNRLLEGPDSRIAIDTMIDTYVEIPEALFRHWPTIAACLTGARTPALVNCTAGKDRTGVAIALVLEIAGVPREAIMDDYMKSAIFGQNIKLSGTLEDGLMGAYGFIPAPGQIDALIGVREEYLVAAWDRIDQTWGSVDGYFEAAGLSLVARHDIATHLTEPKG